MNHEFDKYSDSYGEALNQSLAVTAGMDKSFFDQVKIDCIRGLCRDVGAPSRILDYGCGSGSIAALLAGSYPAARVVGYDVSKPMIEVNSQKHVEMENLVFMNDVDKSNSYDLVVVSNVLHHVVLQERTAVLRRIGSMLSDGGLICVFEHNPLNPLSRWIVSRCAFDEGVSLVWPTALRRISTAAGLMVRSCRYVLHLPLKWHCLRHIERIFCKVPLGAQYVMTLAKSGITGGRGG